MKHKIEYILGSEKEFEDFLNNIDAEKDRVAIVTDEGDLDGLSSGIFMEEILQNKGIKNYEVFFATYYPDQVLDLISELEEGEFSHVITMDLAFEGFKGFEELRSKFNYFLIDHHPLQKEFVDTKGIIKTKSHDCAAWVVYNLGKNLGLLDFKKWEKLAKATVFTEFSYLNHPDKLTLIADNNPNITPDNVKETESGKLGISINNAILYLGKDHKTIFNLIKKEDYQEISTYSDEIEKELTRLREDFWKNAEFNEAKQVYFYEINSKYYIKKTFSSIISLEKPECIFVIYTKHDNAIPLSMRSQSGRVNLNELIKKSIMGLNEATGGGHPKAAGATISLEDFPKFKENILHNI